MRKEPFTGKRSLAYRVLKKVTPQSSGKEGSYGRKPKLLEGALFPRGSKRKSSRRRTFYRRDSCEGNIVMGATPEPLYRLIQLGRKEKNFLKKGPFLHFLGVLSGGVGTRPPLIIEGGGGGGCIL